MKYERPEMMHEALMRKMARDFIERSKCLYQLYVGHFRIVSKPKFYQL